MNESTEMHRIKVRISEMKVAKGDAVLVSYGLGSCAGVAIFDPEHEVGGMAHILLPGKPREGDSPLKFSETAVRILVDEIVAMGGAKENMLAKVVGGANMFSWLGSENKKPIGDRNIEAVIQQLDELGIKIVAKDVGGTKGRTVEFHPCTGEIKVRNAHGETSTI